MEVWEQPDGIYEKHRRDHAMRKGEILDMGAPLEGKEWKRNFF